MTLTDCLLVDCIMLVIVAAHESEDNSHHVVLPQSIKTIRLQVM